MTAKAELSYSCKILDVESLTEIMMLKKKICMVGASAVGKTSLAQRFIRGIYSDYALTATGVKIDKKSLLFHEKRLDVFLWDIYGGIAFEKIQFSYLKGTAGYILVVDGTRKITLDAALVLAQQIRITLEKVPSMLVFNKYDLKERWEIEDAVLEKLSDGGYAVALASAKSNYGVESIFSTLLQKMFNEQQNFSRFQSSAQIL